jgi:hypothetical protein
MPQFRVWRYFLGAEIARQMNHQNGFYHFGRLKLKAGNVEPSFRSVDFPTYNEHRDKQDYRT